MKSLSNSLNESLNEGKQETTKLTNFLKTLTDKDYMDRHTYDRMDEVTEILRGKMMYGMKGLPKPIKINGLDNIYFNSKEAQFGVLAEFRAVEKDGKFTIQELNDEGFSKYENEMG